MKTILRFVALAFVILGSTPTFAADLIVSVTGIDQPRGVIRVVVITDPNGAARQAQSRNVDLAAARDGVLTTALDGTGFLTAGLAAFTGLAGTFTTLAAGLAFTAVDAALAAGLALTATFGAAFLAATLTDDLLVVFTSCLLAVQLTRTACASPSHRTQSVHLHQNPWVGPSGAGGPQ